MPTRVDAIRREHVETFIADQLERWTPSTAGHEVPVPAAVLQVAGRGGRDHRVADGPHAAAKRVQDLVPVLTDADLKRLLAACDGKGFNDRREVPAPITAVRGEGREGVVRGPVTARTGVGPLRVGRPVSHLGRRVDGSAKLNSAPGDRLPCLITSSAKGHGVRGGGDNARTGPNSASWL